MPTSRCRKRVQMASKPKFKIGQIVFIDEDGSYGVILDMKLDEDGISRSYEVSLHHDSAWFWEEGLRKLTKAERG